VATADMTDITIRGGDLKQTAPGLIQGNGLVLDSVQVSNGSFDLNNNPSTFRNVALATSATISGFADLTKSDPAQNCWGRRQYCSARKLPSASVPWATPLSLLMW